MEIEIEKIRKQTIVETVMDKIRELIASGKYKVNDRLPTENELAEMFGIGRSSIREAIKVFNYLGILESRTARGTYVCSRNNIARELMKWAVLLGDEQMYEIVDLRESIELWAVTRLTDRYREGSPDALEQVKKLENIMARLEKAVENKSFDELVESDLVFHNIIISSPGNRTLSEIFSVLQNFMIEEIKQTYKVYTDYSKIICEHSEILKDIKTGNSDMAARAILEHLGNIREKLKAAQSL